MEWVWVWITTLTGVRVYSPVIESLITHLGVLKNRENAISNECMGQNLNIKGVDK